MCGNSPGVPQRGGVKRQWGGRPQHFLAFRWLLSLRPALSALDKDQQESCAVAGKPHDAVVKFYTVPYLLLYVRIENLQRIGRFSL